MVVVETIPDKCRRCYACVRNCPAKAIRIEHGQATVIQERCIGCGRCVRVCTQKAKKVYSGIALTEQFLQNDAPVYAILAPSFPAAFPHLEPSRVVGALKLLGFSKVCQVAFGADLVAMEYSKLYQQRSLSILISTPCPAIVNYIEKYYPSLLFFLAPVVSPMIALGRYLRETIHAAAKIVFIGPCIAKKKEIHDPRVSGIIDEVLTFTELGELFNAHSINLRDCQPMPFDPPHPLLGGVFPLSGGLLKSAGLKDDLLDSNIIVTEGADRVLEIIQRVEEGKIEATFLDVLFCEGCINGPGIDNDLSIYVRHDLVSNFMNSWLKLPEARSGEKLLSDLKNGVTLERKFSRDTIKEAIPTEQEIQEILLQMNKKAPEDELNCGACGYPSCRAKAIAVYQGIAEAEMCFPFITEKLEKMNKSLLEAQEQLVQTARLSSMGELAAGVAHEINNPLAGCLTYLRLMQRKVQADGFSLENLGKFKSYLDMMYSETARVSEIVKTLLEFARPSEPKMTPVSVIEIIRKTLFMTRHQITVQNIRLIEEHDLEHDTILADAKQIQQVLLNLVINAAQAMPNGGTLIVKNQSSRDPRYNEVLVTDSGCGIPVENLERIFEPFFTTRSESKGTGLGLSMAYSIVSKHQGKILVKSKVGEGTTFTIQLLKHQKYEGV